MVLRQKGESQNGCYKKNKARQIFKKNEHFLPPDTHMHIRRQEMFVFQKIWHALFSCNIRFESFPFALLATKLSLFFTSLCSTSKNDMTGVYKGNIGVKWVRVFRLKHFVNTPFFISNAFFQLSLSVPYLFNELSLNCCSSFAYYIYTSLYPDTSCFICLCLFLRLSLFM